MTLRNLLNEIDFDMEINSSKDGNYISLIDLQEANLGGIESEMFFTVESVLDRMEKYWDDYFIIPLADEIGIRAYAPYEEIYNKALEVEKGNNSFPVRVLDCLLNPEKVICTLDLNKSLIVQIEGWERLKERYDKQMLYEWADILQEYEMSTEEEMRIDKSYRYIPKIILLWENMISIDDFIEMYG